MDMKLYADRKLKLIVPAVAGLVLCSNVVCADEAVAPTVSNHNDVLTSTANDLDTPRREDPESLKKSPVISNHNDTLTTTALGNFHAENFSDRQVD